MSLSNLKITLRSSSNGSSNRIVPKTSQWEKAPAGMASYVLSTSNNDDDGQQQRAWVHLPDTFDKRRMYPFMVVLHGAGKGSYWNLEESIREFATVANQYDVIVLYPEAKGSTWDWIRTGGRNDVQFIEYAMNAVRQTWPNNINDEQIALKGISDGGSMALSLGTYNPDVIQACLSVSAGFCRLEEDEETKQQISTPTNTKRHDGPHLFLEHGENDTLFPLHRVGRRNETKLKSAGYPVEFRVAKGQGHVPDYWRSSFLKEWLSLSRSLASRA